MTTIRTIGGRTRGPTSAARRTRRCSPTTPPLADLREKYDALTDGDFRVLLANDADETVAYGRATDDAAAVVAFNRSGSTRTLTIPVDGYLPDGTSLGRRFGVGVGTSGSVTVVDGAISLTLPPMSGLVLATNHVDLDAAGSPDRAPRHRRGRQPGVDRLESCPARRRLRRLGQPADRRRLRQGERGTRSRARRSRSTGSRMPAATTSSSELSTPPATRATRRTRSSACRT